LQIVVPPVAVTLGDALTETTAVASPLHPDASVMIHEYNPLLVAVAFGIVGLAMEEVNPPGPDHE
jgi:hypothetical protein